MEAQQEQQARQADLFLAWSKAPTQPEPVPEPAPQSSGAQ